MNERARIVRFVRETLGCTCPQEVFERLSWAFVDAEEGLPRRFRVDVGGRLLVEAVESATIDAERLVSLLRAGRDRRDRGGYNRFRLALVGEGAAPDAALRVAFEAEAAGDEKLHLHCVAEAPWAE